MKYFFHFILLGVITFSCSIAKEQRNAVDLFIDDLKDQKTRVLEVPEFTKEDIDDLLSYRNDDELITEFPRNLLSSFYQEEVSIGMYVLWIIESVRITENENLDAFKFASLNPRVAELPSGNILNQVDVLPEVANAYDEWWNSTEDLEDKLNIDPLNTLVYFWN